MLHRFFTRPARPAHALPPGLRVYAIGDIHGRLDCLLALEDRVRAHEAGRQDNGPPETTPAGDTALVIFLGDYIDRGPQSREVIDVLARGTFAGLPARCLMGNHEDAMLAFLEDEHDDGAWLDWGGVATLMSYGVPGQAFGGDADLPAIRQELRARLPETHFAFLKGLELSIQLGDYLFVHAGIRPGVDLERQQRADLLGIRSAFLRSTAPSPVRVVHGHTIFEEPVMVADRISLDTGAYRTGLLSCAVIEGETAQLLGG